MNLTDLRTELDRQADRVDGAGELPLPAIRSKATGIRRRRIATAALAVALVATAVPLTVGSFTDPAQPPVAGLPAQPAPDVVRDGIRYRGNVDGDVLLKAEIADVGRQQFSFTWTPPAGEIQLRPFCTVPDYTPPPNQPANAPYWGVVRIDGKVLIGTECERAGADDPGDTFNTHASAKDEIGVPKLVPGKPVRITVHVGDTGYEPRTNPKARLGLGIYQVGPMRTVTSARQGLRIPEILDRDGKFYRLVGVRTTPLVDGASVTAATPGDTPLLLLYGGASFDVSDFPNTSGPGTATLTGIDPPASQTRPHGSPSATQVLVAARGPGSATATYHGPAERRERLLLLGVYELRR